MAKLARDTERAVRPADIVESALAVYLSTSTGRAWDTLGSDGGNDAFRSQNDLSLSGTIARRSGSRRALRWRELQAI